ncbi:uncharacterized protein LOC126382396 [Pectinophora gossypiella]|uniref:uncharacterized protein LOC126368468 n=2 Tax=Pectinophora gossypiella TaxID=13191 RepID=UPI00214ED2D1|nr:uncharacterized protein LOC126368468 [Pectinophora gossypiella]XP_049868935.1 uncharacterized protein LOC126368816 [Pectinophora gossypiella]XP_049877010.1 uncharacterized protein LOC126374410 [Pectinophora gossypiella]XP_049883459.1 uncharacterized protein LOC126378952 [Pectinophora gossypiella]XP_049884684.1 uncharacterized protein LOC126379812 [Pectinophora gossypiella]XP_049888198.1 uncharacterized protein LOC126382396 [Pectinophora gossypiella]
MSSGSTRQTFTEHEKVCLQELVLKYKLNSVATIGAGNANVKKMAWVRLTQEFNSIETNSKRTEAQLKKCWDNLKTRRKQFLAQEKRERMRTGGGLYAASTSQGSQEAIDAALLDATNIELQGVFDSDSDMVLDHNMLAPVPDLPAPAAPAAPANTSPGEGPSQIQKAIPVEVDIEIMDNQYRPSAGSRLSDYDPPSLIQESVPVAQVELPRRPSTGLREHDYGAPSQTQASKNIRAHVINQEFTLRKDRYQVIVDREEELHKLRIAEREWLVKAAEETYHKARLEKESAQELLLCSRAKRELAELHLSRERKK